MKISIFKKGLALALAAVCACSAGGYRALAEETTVPESTTEQEIDPIVTTTQSAEEAEQAKAEAQKTLEEQRATIEAGLKASEEKLKELGDGAKDTEEYMVALDEKIGYMNEELILLQNEVAAANVKIAELDEQIAPLQEQLDALQAEYDVAKAEYDALEDNFNITYKAYCLRLRAMYVSGNSSIIVALLTSKDISQFLNRFEMIKAVSKSDTALLQQVTEQMDEIMTKQDGLEAKQAALDAAKAELDTAKAEYEAEKTSVNAKAAELESKKQVLAAERATYDKLFMDYAINNQIYLDYSDDSEAALANIDAEIDALLSGRKSADEVTTAENPELKDKDEVELANQTGEVFVNSNAALSLGWPVPGHSGVSQEFGHYFQGKAHGGMDIPCPSGTSVVAAQKGIVIRSEWHYSYGYYVMVYHGTDASGRRICTLYAHNSTLLVKVGQAVYKGTVLAKSGSTGNSTGPHCHFEVRVSDTRVNPRNYL
ncbi:MAG: peptidoglycan DD-metalloendopeptidase family protein [Eubacterium sp.]|nr:peptidoglycan DD-metalloendopeptidase family protein [Eubacterium sp.]